MENKLLQNWVINLSLQEQSMVVSSLRGYDIESNISTGDIIVSDKLKDVTKMLRYLVVNTGNNKTYASDNILPISIFAKTLGYYSKIFSVHWHDHILGTIKIIAKQHPNVYIKSYYNSILQYISDHIPVLPNYMYRLECEKIELKSKIDKLTLWINSNTNDVTDDQREQLQLMLKYHDIVSTRLHKYYIVNNYHVNSNNSLDIDKY